MPIQGEVTLLEQVRNVVTTYKGTVGDGMSLADITKIARVSPITLISSSLTGTKELYNILHGVLNIYAGYYLQAVAVLSTQLYDSRVLKILDKTNPDRDLKTFLTAGSMAFEEYSQPTPEAVSTMALENATYTLPFMGGTPKLSLESAELDDFGISDVNRNHRDAMTAAIPRLDAFEKLGMTVGKVIMVSFAGGPTGTGSRDHDKKANCVEVPAVIKLDTMITPSDLITGIATANADEISFGPRFKDAITGRIHAINDFLLCSDLIRAQKKTMIKDVNGFYSQLLKRVNNSKMYSALSGNISMSGISAIYVMSEQDESDIQRKIGGRLTNTTTRDIVFNNTSAMMLVVVDNEWERVSIYIRDIDGFSQNSFDSFKSAVDKQNSNIMDIMKAFSMNTPASF